MAYGARFEWYNVDNLDADASTAAGAVTNAEGDIYALTLGVNYRTNANFIVRPEVRWDWDDDQIIGLEDGDDDQFTFGVDSIFTF